MEGCSEGLENSYFGPIVAMGSSRQKVTDNGLIWGFLDHSFQMLSRSTI